MTRRIPFIAILTAVLFSAGCVNWQPADDATREAIHALIVEHEKTRGEQVLAESLSVRVNEEGDRAEADYQIVWRKSHSLFRPSDGGVEVWADLRRENGRWAVQRRRSSVEPRGGFGFGVGVGVW